MKTASWLTYRGPGRIGISRGTPRGAPAGYKLFRPLNPGPWFHDVSHDEYERLFFAILAKLDPQATWDQLHKLAGDAEPVLLCYEKAPLTPSNFCHRRMAAAWFELELSVEVPEIGNEEGYQPLTGEHGHP
jgi:hypothetical protein